MSPVTLLGLLLLGWISGLFINYLSDVLPTTRRLGRPTCGGCGTAYRWSDYLLLRSCTQCGQKRSLRTWIVQILAVLFTLGLVFGPAFSTRLGFWPAWAVLLFFGVVAVIDIEHRLILYVVCLTGAIVCGVIGVVRHGWLDTVLGGLFGFGIMLVMYWFAALLMKWINRRRNEQVDEVAFGDGDVVLSGVLGLLLGWPAIAAGLLGGIFLAGGAGLLVVIVMLVRRKYQPFMPIPYGPFLLLGAAWLLFR